LRPPHSSDTVQIPSGGRDRTTVAFKWVGPPLPFLGSSTSCPVSLLRSSSPSHRQQAAAEQPLPTTTTCPQRRTVRSARWLLFLFRLAMGKIGSWMYTFFDGAGLGLSSARGFESFLRRLVLRWIWVPELRSPLELRLDGVIQGED
jgi:hypothetical protein